MSYPATNSRSTLRARLLALLIGARGGWVPLAEVMAAAGAQYGARIFECRHNLKLQIQNYQEGGHSFFRLVPGPSMPAPAPKIVATQAELFSSAAHRDEG